jgi:polygalacturonase
MFCFRITCSKLLALFVLIGLNASGAGPVFNVLDYDAHRDGSTNSTEAFRSAIQAAKAAGGGTVFVPAGNYITGPIELVSDLVLHLDAGATLRFPAATLPFTKGRQQGIECLTPVPLIGGHDLHNVTITGRGLLTTENAEWLKLMPRTKASGDDPGSANGPNWERLLQDLEVKTPAPDEDYQKAAPELRPSFIRFMDSTNVLIEGIHFVGSPMWTIHLLYTDNAVVQNVIIETYPGVHTDGIAVDSSRNVRIASC